MTNEKQDNLENKTENSYTKENSILKTFNQIHCDSQSKTYSDFKRELDLYSKNNPFKNYNCSFYSTIFV